jgi:peptide/nickel transport system substrate-binding protein
MPVFKQNAEKAGFRIFTTHSFNNPLQLGLNQDYQYDDPNSVWQKLMSDPEKRFVKAIGFAIDAQNINNSVFFGMFGAPFSTTKVHDPQQANQLLDAIGMDKRDADNFRLGPDGNPFLLEIAYAVLTAEFDPVAELLSQQIQAVGMRVKLQSSGTDQTAWSTKGLANQFMATIHWNDGPAWNTAISEDYLPASKHPWSPATWVYFTSNGKQGRKPPDYLQRFYDLHVARKAFTPDSAEGQKAFKDLMDWFDQNYILFPATGPKVLPNLANVHLQNVQKDGAPYELDTYLSADGLWFDNV